MEHAKHIVRAVLLLVVVVLTLIVARHFAIPKSFGLYGAYRYDNVAEHAALSPVHGAPDACVHCHEEQAEARSEGKQSDDEIGHSSVSCEVCHAPLAGHVEGTEWTAKMPVLKKNSLCLRCHERLDARPKDFPQVVLSEHLEGQDVALSEGVCLECHNAHNPYE